jgi:WD40 repeat protein
MSCLTVIDAGGPHAIIVRGPALEIIDLSSGASAGTIPAGLARIEAVAGAELDGRPIAICVASGRLHAFELSSGARLDVTFAGAAPQVITVGVLGGRPVLIGGAGSELRRWDIATGAEIGGPLAVHQARITALTITVSADRPIVVSADADGVIHRSDLGSGEEAGDPVHQPGRQITTLLALEIDGSPVTATNDGADLAIGTAKFEEIDSAAVATLNGRPILVTEGLDESVRAWSLPDGSPIGEPWADETVSITAVAVGHVDGRPIAVSGDGDGRLRRWDLTTLTPAAEDPGDKTEEHTSWVRAIATTEVNGRVVAVTAADRTLRVWDLATGAPAGPAIDTRYPTTVLAAATWNGLTIAVCLHSDGRTRAWDLATGDLAAGPLEEWSGARAFAQAGGVIYAITEDHPYDEAAAAYDRNETALQAWDLAAGRLIGKPMIGGGHGGNVMWPPVAVVQAGDRPVIVSGAGRDGRLRVWDLTGGDPLTEPLAGHDGELTAVAALVHDGRLVVVTGGEDGLLRVWDQGASTVLSGHTGRITSVAVDGTQVVSGSADGTVRVWDLISGALKARFRAR